MHPGEWPKPSMISAQWLRKDELYQGLFERAIKKNGNVIKQHNTENKKTKDTTKSWQTKFVKTKHLVNKRTPHLSKLLCKTLAFSQANRH